MKQKKPKILKNIIIKENFIITIKKNKKNQIELKNFGTQKWKGNIPSLIKKKKIIKNIPNKLI